MAISLAPSPIRVFLLCLLLLASPLPRVVRCQSDPEVDVVEAAAEEGGDGELGIVGDDVADFGDGSFSPAPGIDSICVFPKNGAKCEGFWKDTLGHVTLHRQFTLLKQIFNLTKLFHVVVPAGEETELLVGLKNNGESDLEVIAIKASIHLPFDHRLLVQNLTVQGFRNSSVPASAQATFPYIFGVSKYFQAGNFDLVGTIIYEMDQQPYQSTFYNGTIEVVEAGGLLSMESVFLVTLGIALLVLLGLWINGRIQQLSKKTKRVSKVEVGTGTTDASLDEWLQGTAYTQSTSIKKKKK